MYEDMKPLFANPVLPLLAIALADRAFQDYETFKEIEAIPSPADGSLHHLQIKKGMLRVPFFHIVSVDGPTGKIHGAGSFSNRTVDLGHRAGHEKNIGIHDIRREALVKADGKFMRTKPLRWDTLTRLKIMVTRSPKGWNSPAIITQIPSSAHTRLS